jgi:Uma2 family endonuclease
MSPSTKTKDLTAKLELYMKGGVSEYWIANPEAKRIDIFTFIEKEISDTLTYKINENAQSVIFKGMTVSVDDVF